MRISVALSLLVVLGAPALAKAPPPSKTPKPAGKPASPAASPLVSSGNNGTLTINCATVGADVLVDGEKIGSVPLGAPVGLPAGEHTIKLIKPGFAPLIDVFTVTKRRDTKLDVELVAIAGIGRMTANVEKARVFVDGKFVCEVPCLADLGVGARAVQVSKGGYKDFFQNVSAVAGQEVAMDIKLEELPMGLNPYKPPPPPPRKWYEKWWVWTVGVAGLAVVATAVAVPAALSQQDPVKNFNANYNFTIQIKMPGTP